MSKDSRDIVVEAIRTGTAELNVAAETRDELIRRLAPSIRLERDPKVKSSVGGTRAGGMPDLPDGVEWPQTEETDEPMPFVLQVNLADVAPFDVEGVLPKAGLLSIFFYTEDEDSGEEGRILYFPDPLPALKRQKAPGGLDAEKRYRPVPLKASLEWTLASDILLDEDFESWFELRNRIIEAQGFDDGNGDIFQLLGHPLFVQSYEMRKKESLFLEIYPDYEAVEDDPRTTGMMWGDGGQVYFIMKTADLKAHAFDRLSVILDMC